MIGKSKGANTIGELLIYGCIEAYLEAYGECPCKNLGYLFNRDYRELYKWMTAYAKLQQGTVQMFRGVMVTMTGYEPKILAKRCEPLLMLSMVAQVFGGEIGDIT